MQTWGCTDLQIGGVLLQALGFGVTFSNSYVMGLTPTLTGGPRDPACRAFSACSMWIDALLKTGNDPQVAIDTKFYPLVEPRMRLMETIEVLRESGSVCNWLSKNKEDLSPELTPVLFRAGAVVTPTTTSSEGESVISDSDVQSIDSEISD